MSTAQPIISVIVPVYNQDKIVERCINSILNQDFQNLEVIVINDGSIDNTLNILKEVANQDHRVKIIDKKNEGVSRARRDGLKASKGQFICFVDGDDNLSPNALKNLYDIIIREDVDIVIGQCIRTLGPFTKKTYCNKKYSERRIVLPELWDELYISYMGVNILPVQIWGKLYKKDVIDRAMASSSLFSDSIRSMADDEYFNMMLHPFVESIFITNQHVYVYRYGGVTTSYNKHFKELYEMSDIRIKLLDEYHYEKGYNVLYIEYKNCIFSDILQRMEYCHSNKQQIDSFLKEELGKRETFKRMHAFYEGKSTDEEMSALLSQDTDKIWLLANRHYDKGRKRRWLKKCIHFFYR